MLLRILVARRAWFCLALALLAGSFTSAWAGSAAPAVQARVAYNPGQINIFTYHSAVDDSDQPFSVYVPSGFNPAIAHPCVIYLHGWAGRLRTFPVTPGMQSFADARQWLLAFPDGRGSVNYDHVGELDVLQVRQFTIGSLNADPDRIYLQGFSMGGHGAYRLALRFPDKFAASSPQAGWTDHNEFYPHWYQQTTAPRLPSFLDPTRAPLLQHAASLPQAENGLPVAFRVFYHTGDPINPPLNATRIISAWRALSHPRLQVVARSGGHLAEPLENAYPFFEGKAVNRDPEVVVYRTWRLRHDGAFWVRIGAFRARGAQARLRAQALPSSNEIEVEAANVERFTLSPSPVLLPGGGNVTVRVNGQEAFQGPWPGSLTLHTQRGADGIPNGWSDIPPPPPLGLRKVKGLEGPISEATRGPFVVIYGAKKGPADPATLANKRDAQLFCGQWNAMMILRWTFQTFPAPNNPIPASWFEPPYPFTTDPQLGLMNAAQAIVPLSDQAAAGASLGGKNLILFGDPDSNDFINAIRNATPITLHTQAEGGGVSIGTRTYGGPDTRYAFVYPRSVLDAGETDSLLLVSKGFLSSLPGLNWSGFDVAKDFEQWPWLLPDFVIWDRTRAPTGIVNPGSTYRYLPESYLEAGFFTAAWQLDAQPPKLRAFFNGVPDPNQPATAFVGAGEVTAEAVDGAGESGLDSIEYRVNGGAWTPYSGPLPHDAPGTTLFEFRASDRGASYLYGPDPVSGAIRPTGAARNTSAPLALSVTINPLTVPDNGFLVRRINARLASPGALTQPGDRLVLRAELGANLLTSGVANRTLSFTLGTLSVGPFVSDNFGRFSGTDGAAGRVRGRIFIRRGRRWLTLVLRNVDLEAAFGIAPADTFRPVTADVTLILGAQTMGPASYPARLRRRYVNRAGRLLYRQRFLLHP